MNTTTLLTVMKHLVNDRSIDWVATATGLTAAEVEKHGREWGWPDKQRMRFSVDELSRQATQEQRRSLPTGTTTTGPAKATARPAGTVRHRAPVPVSPEFSDGLAQLLAKAGKATGPGAAKVKAAAEKLRKAHWALTTELEKLEERKREAAQAEAARAKARAEVERLEKELAAAKARLGKSTAKSKPDAAESKRIREWAKAHGIPVASVGVIRTDVVDAYRQATA